MRRNVNCSLNLSPESDTCRGTSCSTCGWNPTVDRKRKARIRKEGALALCGQKKTAPTPERQGGCG